MPWFACAPMQPVFELVIRKGYPQSIASGVIKGL
jgi:hypothetical protein